jgi:hypothetical protein
VFYVVFELSDEVGSVFVGQLALAILQVGFPLAFVSIAVLIINLYASSLFLAMYPLSTVIVTIFVHHLSITVRSASNFFTFVPIGEVEWL